MQSRNGNAHVLNARVIESPVDAIELGYPTFAGSAAAVATAIPAATTATTTATVQRPFM